MNITELSGLVDTHGKAIYGFCYNLAKNKEDADVLYQETFLKASELCHKIDGSYNPKGFLISVAVKVWKNNRRKYAWRQRIAPIAEIEAEENNLHMQNVESSLDDAVIFNEMRDVLQNAAHGLDDKFKIPLYMYYTAEMSIAEIASALKIPQGTVKSRLHKARINMKKSLEAIKYE